ncbi:MULTISPECIES: GNAT family N-acetyltransferase [unclassified Novosphingobium]|uniref:GNAT family N-acetyltransferase n=1 Tax=unclassified Novosphingobium TaxID=2644732 RepID=UPI00146D31DF|nr:MULTISPECIES: GNAT family N-acetyltransferase [unclassified Novosphingobium]NMN05610.1 RimJ/RimL family protein N-acetyltransferase [Novosphingobium sp. SG919]NMN88030.1 RimJ/RimL family protein N-acetyltransferase [Novosphingobium sp. SG916]
METDPQPALLTERLALWHPHPRDHAGLVDLLAPEAVRRHLGNRPTGAVEEFQRLLRNAGSWALYGYGIFTCRRRDDDAVVGIAGVFHSWRGFGEGLDDVPEAGWIFAESCWGQGLAREAMAAALDWFDQAHGPRRVACMIDGDNAPSLALAARLGFVAYAEQPDPGRDVPLLLLERNTGAA